MVFQLSAACDLLNLKKKKLYLRSRDYSDFRDSSKKFQYHISEKRLKAQRKHGCELLSMIGIMIDIWLAS